MIERERARILAFTVLNLCPCICECVFLTESIFVALAMCVYANICVLHHKDVCVHARRLWNHWTPDGGNIYFMIGWDY